MFKVLHAAPRMAISRRNTRQPRLGVTQLKRGAQALVVGAVLTLLYTGYEALQDTSFLPITEVKVDGELRWLDRTQLQQRVNRYAGAGLLSLDIDFLRQELEAMPWVQAADIRRVLPNTLFITITEHRPVARWNQDYLLGRDASVFNPENGDLRPFSNLPTLNGPEGHQRLLHKTYMEFSRQLAPLGLTIVDLRLDPRRSWRVQFSDGVELMLGNEETEQRLARFVEVYPQTLRPRWAEIAGVDLRYPHGFAVRWQRQASQ